MEKDVSNLLSLTGDGDNEQPSKSCAEKKLRLFGFELDPNKNNQTSLKVSLERDERIWKLTSIGGHQNAHKKERMKKKRLQIQARKASINYYLQPLRNSYSFSYFCDPSCYASDFSQNVSQISFGRADPDAHLSGSQAPTWHDVPVEVAAFQPNTCGFTLTCGDRSGESQPAVFKPGSKRQCKSLDLQLGLSMHSNIESSFRSGM
ncbi:zinc finger protein 5 [Actinidia rufa]|uniref:Zinc finger protein 5 n=1 Tax=Actinidia rufa TaxID=165716 RepID=A0A7J0HDU3_9ERIC|nr:zinc finger protein 5 [Actinidia rufa]